MSTAVFSSFSSFTLVGLTTISNGAIDGRQPEAVFVVALLDGGGQNALDANAITAHDRRDFFAVFVEHARAHGFGIFVSELEDVADFDGGVDAKRGAAVGTGFARSNAAQVGVGGGLEVVGRA